MEFHRAYDPFRALGSAWRILWRAPVVLFLGGFLLCITDPWSVGSSGWDRRGWIEEGNLPHELLPFVLGVAGIGALALFVVGFLLFLFHCLMRVGFGAAVQRLMVTGNQDLADLVRPRGLYGSMVFGLLLHILLVVLATVPFGLFVGLGIFIHAKTGIEPAAVLIPLGLGILYVLVWIWILLGILLMPEAIAIEGLDPVSALARSWSLTRGHRLCLFFYLLVQVVVVCIGFCFCCVGVIGTYSWSMVAWYESYVRLTMPEPDEGLWIDRGEPVGTT